jgi:hypothetical protein
MSCSLRPETCTHRATPVQCISLNTCAIDRILISVKINEATIPDIFDIEQALWWDDKTTLALLIGVFLMDNKDMNSNFATGEFNSRETGLSSCAWAG